MITSIWGILGRSGSTTTLCVIPDYDPLTTRLWSLLRPLIIKRERLVEIVLDRAQASRRGVIDFIGEQKQYSWLVFAGHGSPDCLQTAPLLGILAERFDNLHSVLLCREDNLRWKGVIVFSYSCMSGQQLGPSIGRAGAGFVGYSIRIPFVRSRESDDRFDDVFGEPFRLALATARDPLKSVDDLYVALGSWYDKVVSDLRVGEKAADRHCRALRLALMAHRFGLCRY